MANRITTTFDFKERGSGLKKIKADVEGVDGAWNKAKVSAKGAYDEFKNNRVAQAAVAGMVVKIGTDAVNAASDLEESINAVNQAFGGAAGGVLALSENSAEAFGVSQRAFNEMALGLSGFAEQLSAGGAGSVPDLIDDLIGRATDFGSVWNRETSEVASAFRSFLSGESEPMKQFGIVIDEAAVKSRALEMGLADVASELTTQDKQLARYNLLMEETAYTAGDWNRTSEGLAGSQKTLAAEIENSQAIIGKALIPVVESATSAMVDLASGVGDVDQAIKDMSGGEQDLGSTIGAALDIGSAPFRGLMAYNSAVFEFVGLTGDATESIDGMYASSRRAGSGHREAARATAEMELEAVKASEAMRDEARAANHVATVMGDVEDRQQAAAEATERHRAAVEALFDEVQSNIDSTFDYEKATLAVEDAVKDFADATVEALEVANDSEASAADREQALRDMRSAEIDAAESARDAATAYAESQGAIEGTTEFASLQRQELDRLADKFPELSDEIAQFVAELDRIPAVKTVSLVLERNSVNSQLQRSGTSARVDEFGNLRQFDTGGVVPGPRGSAQLAVVHGGETILPTHKTSLPRVGAMGGVTIGSVVVQAPAGADADAFGRAVREAIRRETRWSGPVTGWSAA